MERSFSKTMDKDTIEKLKRREFIDEQHETLYIEYIKQNAMDLETK